MKLKEVSLEKLQQKDKQDDLSCMNEMMTLFDCFEKNDFSSQLCQQHVSALEQCVNSHKNNKQKNK